MRQKRSGYLEACWLVFGGKEAELRQWLEMVSGTVVTAHKTFVLRCWQNFTAELWWTSFNYTQLDIVRSLRWASIGQNLSDTSNLIEHSENRLLLESLQFRQTSRHQVPSGPPGSLPKAFSSSSAKVLNWRSPKLGESVPTSRSIIKF